MTTALPDLTTTTADLATRREFIALLGAADEQISTELIGELDADAIVMFRVPELGAQTDALLADPLFRRLPAVAAGRFTVVPAHGTRPPARSRSRSSPTTSRVSSGTCSHDAGRTSISPCPHGSGTTPLSTAGTHCRGSGGWPGRDTSSTSAPLTH